MIDEQKLRNLRYFNLIVGVVFMFLCIVFIGVCSVNLSEGSYTINVDTGDNFVKVSENLRNISESRLGKIQIYNASDCVLRSDLQQYWCK